MTPSATAPLDLGRSDVLPGFILSKPRWTDLGELENTFNTVYTVGMIRAAQSSPPEIRKEIFEVVAAEIRRRPFSFGRPGFDESAFMWPVFPMLLWMSLRVKHGTLTLAQVDDLIAAMDDEKRADVRRAVLEFLGYKFETPATEKKKSGDAEALDFRKIYEVLRKKELQPSEILNLTFDQVLIELGVNPEVEELKAERAKLAADKQREVLTKAAESLGKTLAELSTVDPAAVADAVARVTGKSVDAVAVGRAVAELAKAA